MRSERAASPAADGARAYDAVLLAGFGGPRRQADVVPFLRNVTAGKGIPDERLAEVGAHYALFGGRSPINEATEDLRAALGAALAETGIDLPVVVGNRNWDPYTADGLRQVVADGGTRVLAVLTSAYTSYSGCRQYREDIAAQVAELGGAVRVDVARAYFNTPGFVRANVDAVVDAFESLAAAGYSSPELVVVTHSIPLTMEAASAVDRPAGYVRQHEEVGRLVAAGAAERLGRRVSWRLAYCSRSGPPHVPWLEPDVNDELTALAATGTSAVVVAPIGFIADHMEVVYDLDTEAAATARDLGLAFARAATAGTHPAFVASLADLVRERVEGVPPAVVGVLPPWDPECGSTCCRPQGRPGHTDPPGHPASRPSSC